MKTVSDLPLEVEVKTSKSKSTVPVVTVPTPPKATGIDKDVAVVARYAELTDKMDTLKAERTKLENFLKERGMAYVVETNVANVAAGREPISSVKYQDPADENVTPTGPQDAVMISVVNDYLKFDQEVVETTLNGMKVGGKKADPNAYLEWQIVSEFDSEVFYKEGTFDMTRFLAFKEAVQKVADKLGVDNPLTVGKVLRVQDTFHTRRWKDFSVDDNLKLATVLPCKITPKLVRPKAA